ncbi:uncharacterized protein CEXT_84721 [Caerostris extrusa]|uniref:Monocarboxylate transporter n=1 Tax=Caerostris extrusa TaxID=172846 RepID=A0AAV4RKC7_CAEEX|nr:uncharacterized protein CEXT_84721 [Caerostris extrusa]
MKNASRTTSRSWAIAAICSFINFLHLGVARQSGLLYLAAMARYDANRNQASLPFVLCYTVRNISGPLVGYLGRKIGLESVTVLGCIIASVGMGACYFAEDITMVTVLWGGVFGLGFGMGSVLIPVILNQHFDKYLSNANGIAFGGECVAGFILPVLIKILLDSYGTSGLFLILSGLMLHSVPAAMLLKASATNPSRPAHKPETGHPSLGDTVLFSGVDGIYNKSFHLDDTVYWTPNSLPSASQDTSLTSEMLKEMDKRRPVYNDKSNEISMVDNFSSNNYQKNEHEWKSINLNQEYNLEEISIPGLTKDSNSIRDSNMNHKTGSHILDSASKSNENNPPIESSKASSSHSFRVFLDPAFILMLLTQSTFIFIGTMILTIIVDLSRDAGVSTDEEIYILMCLSISDMLGRFGLGWVTDKGYMTNVTFSCFCYFSLGIILTALVFIKGFILIMVAAFFIGLFLGGLLIVCPGIVSDHIENDKITMALSSRFVLYAPISLTQSSLIGFFRGSKGSYNGILYMLTAVCLLCCVMSLSIPLAARFRERRKEKARLLKQEKL